jgi:hypothetical protein
MSSPQNAELAISYPSDYSEYTELYDLSNPAALN